MNNQLFLRFLTICCILLVLSPSLVSCQSTSKNTPQDRDVKPAQKIKGKPSPGEVKIANQREYFNSNTEAMDYFFRTFFSGNFIAAYQATSSTYRLAHPFEVADKEWHSFYKEVLKQGMTRKYLSYRTDLQTVDGDVGSMVISPQGRMIMRVYLKQLGHENHKVWMVDNVVLFRKSLTVRSGNGKQSLDLTKEVQDQRFKDIYTLITEEIKTRESFRSEDLFIKRLIVSEDWARAIPGDSNNVGLDSAMIILHKVDGKWKVIGHDVGLTYNDYPESPYTLWIAND